MESTIFVLGRDAVGVVAEDRDPGYKRGPFRYYLTECCGASSKGLEDGMGGGYTGCRSCYEQVDPGLGGCPDRDTVFVKGEDRPEGDVICRETLFGGGWWVSVDKPLALIDVYGDGLAYDEWKARVTS
jgi:hypothetical protein